MKKKTKDWLMSKTLAERNTMFENVETKVETYKAPFGLTGEWIASVVLLCQMFREAYAKVMQNRATEKQMNEWFDLMLNADARGGVPVGSPLPAAPVFQEFAMPAGSIAGLYDVFREKMEFFKSNEAYNESIGEDLMIVAPESEEESLTEAAPVFKYSADVNGNVLAKYTRGDFGGAEVQWREVGQLMWQAGDKSDQTEIVFKPNVSTPGAPVKLELRGVYLLKGQRVGQWSQIGTLTYG
jgi:hypothetical protein